MNITTVLASARAARARVVRGFARVTGSEAALDAAIEARAARAAVAMDTPVGDIQAAQTRAAWTTQIGRLEAIERRDAGQEMLLRQLRRNVRDLDAAETLRHATPQGLGEIRLSAVAPVGRPMGFIGSFGASPLTGLLMSPVVWVAAAFAIPAAVAGVQTARLNHAKADLRETREDLALAVEQRDAWRERAGQYAEAVADARETAEATAEALNQERRRQAAAARRERERQRAIQNVLVGSPEPPAWSLRNDESVSERSGSDD